ncbi:MAG: protein kinase, partial [Terriglobus roseus]|nr:protein kinase [Terriglobus roseus]
MQVVVGSRFQVERPLAIGGMATIFQMRHRLHNGLFVAKVLHPELAESPGVLRSFRLEATHAAMLGDHPNAVPVFDFGELDGIFFLLMPYIAGEDLDQMLARRGPLGREEALQMAAQLSSLLCHAESKHVVHCDLTPGNIRRDNFGQYRLLDLGISQANGPQ